MQEPRAEQGGQAPCGPEAAVMSALGQGRVRGVAPVVPMAPTLGAVFQDGRHLGSLCHVLGQDLTPQL